MSYDSKVDYSTGLSPYSVVMGDLNGDERPDIITANWDGNTISVLQNNSKIDQPITFSTLPTKMFGDTPFNLSATASSGLPKSYTAYPSGRVIIDNNTVTIVGAGKVTITAHQMGSNNYNEATISQSFCINPGKPTITVTNNYTATPMLNSSTAVVGTSTASYQWYKNGTIKAGATTTLLTLAEGEIGIFKMRVSVDDCFAESDSKTIVITGDISTPQLSVYPNPAKEKVYFGEIGEVQNIQAIDAIGRSHAISVAVEGKIAVGNISELTNGIYVLRIQTTSTTHYVRLLKQ